MVDDGRYKAPSRRTDAHLWWQLHLSSSLRGARWPTSRVGLVMPNMAPCERALAAPPLSSSVCFWLRWPLTQPSHTVANTWHSLIERVSISALPSAALPSATALSPHSSACPIGACLPSGFAPHAPSHARASAKKMVDS